MREAAELDNPVILNTGWSIIFADLLAILLAFFILVFSMTPIEDTSWSTMTKALKGELENEANFGHSGDVESYRPDASLSVHYGLQILEERASQNYIVAQAQIGLVNGQLQIRFKAAVLEDAQSAQKGLAELGDLLARLSTKVQIATEAEAVSAFSQAMQLSQDIGAGLTRQQPALAVSTLVRTVPAKLTNYEPAGSYNAQNWVEITLIE